MQTHESYIRACAGSIALFAFKRGSITQAEFDMIRETKLTYGAGMPGLRGITYYDQWGNIDKRAPFVEVCAFGQEDNVQLAGTTLHELAHVITKGAGHSAVWKDACKRLGLRNAMAAGHTYRMAGFEPKLRQAIAALPKPDDGAPVANLFGGLGKPMALKPCNAGLGTRGGKSRGKGSGSRLRLWECSCEPAFKVRASRDIDCTCNVCSSAFIRV